METLLLSANYAHHVATLLNNLQVEWTRTETTETCPERGACETCKGRRSGSEKAQGVSYYVMSGPLKGHWSLWGLEADQHIFDLMAARLNEAWSEHLKTCSAIGAALRSVGR